MLMVDHLICLMLSVRDTEFMLILLILWNSNFVFSVVCVEAHTVFFKAGVMWRVKRNFQSAFGGEHE